jgi:RHS repeat-associated protein
VQNNFETVTKTYVVDYLSAANRDILVTEAGSFIQRYVYAPSGGRVSAEFDYAEGTERGEPGENIGSDFAAQDIVKVWYRSNLTGSSLVAVDADGEVVTHIVYDAWGEPLTTANLDVNFAGIDNINNFTGYTWDLTLELYYAQARFYDAGAHRFTTEDPARDGGNWYVYCGDNPLTNVDVWGLEKIVVSGNHASGYAIANFLEPAIRTIREWLRNGHNNESITWLIADRGYDDLGWLLMGTLYRMKEDYPGYFSDQDDDVFGELKLKDGIHKLTLKYLKNKDSFFDYITGGIDRTKEKITEMVIFSHGAAGNLALGYNAINGFSGSLNISTTDVQNKGDLSSAFSEDYFCILYACNTGTEKNNTSFAQAWADATGGYVIGLSDGKTDYSNIDKGRSEAVNAFDYEQVSRF